MIRSRIWLPLLAALPVTVAAQTEQTLEQLLELSLTELLQVKVESATLTE